MNKGLGVIAMIFTAIFLKILISEEDSPSNLPLQSYHPTNSIALESPTRNAQKIRKISLKETKRLQNEQLRGPETIIEHPNNKNEYICGTADGKIVKIKEKEEGKMETMVEVGGRPLGLIFDENYNLVVAEALSGLLLLHFDTSFSSLNSSSILHFNNNNNLNVDLNINKLNNNNNNNNVNDKNNNNNENLNNNNNNNNINKLTNNNNNNNNEDNNNNNNNNENINLNNNKNIKNESKRKIKVEKLSTQENIDIRYANDLDILFSDPPMVYFSDSSSIRPIWQFSKGLWSTMRAATLDIASGTPSGRLLEYNTATGEIREVIKGLGYANGVAVSADGKFVLVAETARNRILRHSLLDGKTEVFIDNLPAYPDGISRASDGGYWVAMISPRMQILDFFHPYKWVKYFLFSLPDFMWPQPSNNFGLVVKLSENGEVEDILEDRSGRVFGITSVHETHDGKLLLGSLTSNYISIFDYSPYRK